MEGVDDWIKAGRIAGEALEFGKSLIKKRASYLDVTSKIEERIARLGGGLAFPVQMSMDDVAAHFTVDPGEDIVLDRQLVSLDVGVQVHGAIGDTACTVDLSGANSELVKASEDALKAALKLARPGTRLSEIGRVIGETIEGFGFQPIRNLSGHGLEKFNVHAPPTIPNYDNKSSETLKDGQVIAIEPFATAGAGMIYETGNANIFALSSSRSVRSPIAREVLKEIAVYQGLPFTTRWLAAKMPLAKVNFALREMHNAGVVQAYPPLVEKSHGLVSQAEHSVIVADKPIIITLHP